MKGDGSGIRAFDLDEVASDEVTVEERACASAPLITNILEAPLS